ncbi:MAG: hypothetical protein RQ826_14950 [Xanthomonadales bacterium]|nr:hypothetical protein [Xanthomonadales bacterium]
MPDSHSTPAAVSPTNRSAVTNGKTLFMEKIDGRSPWARRFRDLIGLHISDLGGPDNVSESERQIVRRCATLEVELERLEGMFAQAGEADPATLDLYQRTANSLRRLLEANGLQRRAVDTTPTLQQYCEQNYGAANGS